MRVLINLLLAWPRTTRAAVRIGAVGLLFYAASFYTRDWRPLVAQAGKPTALQTAARPKAEPRPVPSKLAELPTPVEPAAEGALTRMAPTVPPSAAKTASARPTPASPRLQARPANPRSPKQAKPTKRTQVAARPAAVPEPPPVAPSPSFLERLFQVRVADRGT